MLILPGLPSGFKAGGNSSSACFWLPRLCPWEPPRRRSRFLTCRHRSMDPSASVGRLRKFFFFLIFAFADISIFLRKAAL